MESLSASPQFEDLTKVSFTTNDSTLKVAYIKGHLQARSVGYIPGTFTEDFRYTEVAGTIRFSAHKRLLELVRRGGIEPFKVKSFEKPFDVPLKGCSVLFKAIEVLQSEDAKVCVPPTLFQEALGKLEKKGCLTSDERERWQSTIRTGRTLEDYEQQARESRDPEKAISLAYYYRNIKGGSNSGLALLFKDQSALSWLRRAEEYLQGQRLSERINLGEFLEGFDTVYSWMFFDVSEELVMAMARCSSIKKLNSQNNLDCGLYPDFPKLMGIFLRNSTSVKEVELGYPLLDYKQKKLDAETITPIVEALKFSTSIEKFLVIYSRIGDEGVIKILDAIEANPHSKIRILNFAGSCVTDVGAKAVLEFVKKYTQIEWVNVQNNREVSSKLVDEINGIAESRKGSMH